jgi:hypothetical protein
LLPFSSPKSRPTAPFCVACARVILSTILLGRDKSLLNDVNLGWVDCLLATES